MKHLMNRSIHFLVIVTILFGAAFAALAQEDTETPEPESTTAVFVETDEMPSDEALIELSDFVPDDSPAGELLNSILEAIAAVVYLPAAAGIVTVGTSFIKRFTKFPAKFIALTIMLVLWGIYSLGLGLGYETQLNTILDAITQIGFVLLGATGTAIVSTKVYEHAARANMPGVGYSRHVAAYQRLADEADG